MMGTAGGVGIAAERRFPACQAGTLPQIAR
jgi:hypothetical protein